MISRHFRSQRRSCMCRRALGESQCSAISNCDWRTQSKQASLAAVGLHLYTRTAITVCSEHCRPISWQVWPHPLQSSANVTEDRGYEAGEGGSHRTGTLSCCESARESLSVRPPGCHRSPPGSVLQHSFFPSQSAGTLD